MLDDDVKVDSEILPPDQQQEPSKPYYTDQIAEEIG
jgi:hypothetical protein